MSKKYVSIPMDESMWKKLQFIANSESRSVSKQVWYLIRRRIVEFEIEHGTIPIEK